MPARDGSELTVRILGDVRAYRGAAELDLGSAQRRAVLAVLALSANHTVSRHELIDALWGESPPVSASGTIYTYISALRRVLEPDKPPRAGGQVLRSVGSGYSLRLGPDCLDLDRFTELRATAQRHADAGESSAAIEAFDSALSLLRTEPLAGIPGPFAETQRARISELWLTTVERRTELLLATGRHAELVAELSALCKANPLRESLHGLLMRALHGGGRQAEALAVFADLRGTLVETSGIEPGPELRALHQEILEGRETSPAPRKTAVGKARRPEVFVGRRRELGLLRSAVAGLAEGRGRSVWVEGEPGVGKSALLAESLAGLDELGVQLAWGAAHELDRRLVLEPVGADVTDEDRVLATVEELCERGPLILVADDLHWADEASLRVWWRLAVETARLPLLLVGACRPVPCPPEQDRLRGHLVRASLPVTLGPLPYPEVFELVERLIGAPARHRLREVIGHGAGNPFYVKEILNGVGSAGMIVFDGNQADLVRSESRTLPQALVSRIGDHLAFLSEQTRTTLRWAALLGADFTAADVAVAVDRPLTELAETIDEAIAAGVLAESDDRLRFRHPLVRSVLYEKIPAAVRVALHRRLAEALAEAGSPPVQVAEQLSAAPVAVDPWVSDWLLANIGAVTAGNPKTALKLLRHTVGRDGIGPEASEALAATLTRLLFWLGREPEFEARSVVARTADRACAAEMRWILAYLYYRRGNFADALAEVRHALADDRMPDRWRARHETLLTVLTGGASGDADLDRPRLPELSNGIPALGVPGLAEIRLLDTATVTDLGDFGLTGPTASWRLATRCALPAEMHLASALHGYWRGDWQGALDELAALEIDDPGDSSYVLRSTDCALAVHGISALIAGHRGDRAEAREHLRAVATYPRSADEHLRGGDVLLAAKAVLAEQDGRYADAVAALAPIVDVPYLPLALHQWLPDLTRLALRAEDDQRVKGILRLLESQPGDSPVQAAVAAHCRGLVDNEPDELFAACHHYRNTSGRELKYAHTLEDVAAVLAARGRFDEAWKAFEEAVAAYASMGAAWDIRRAERTMRSFGILRAGTVELVS